jgi:hypothetical protein
LEQQPIDNPDRAMKSSAFFHQDTAQRIGMDLTETTDTAMARGDFPLMELFFNRAMDRILQDGEVVKPACREAAAFVPGSGAPVFRKLVLRTPDLQAYVIGLHPLRPIPLHDHPGLWSAQRVVRGCIKLRVYDPGERQEGASSLASLQRLEDREMVPGDLTMVTPAKGNIHGFAALRSSSVMLSVRIRSTAGRSGSLFMPLDPLHDSLPTLLCNRVSRPRL